MGEWKYAILKEVSLTLQSVEGGRAIEKLTIYKRRRVQITETKNDLHDYDWFKRNGLVGNIPDGKSMEEGVLDYSYT